MRFKTPHLAAAGIVAVCVVWIGSGLIGKSAAPPAATGSKAANTARVGVVESTARPVTAEIVLTGTTRAHRSVVIRAETKGRVIEVPAERGARLHAGDLIARLAMDDRAARLTQASSLLAQREIEFTAATKLSDKAFASRVQLATSKAARDTAAAEVAAVRLDIKRTEIRAPFAGILNDRPAEVGDYLAVEGAVGTLVDLDPLKVTVQVSENAVARVARGAVATLTLTDGQKREGVVTFVASSATAATRTFAVEIEVPNPDLAIADGMTAEARLPLGQTMAHRVSPAVLTLSEDGRVGVKTVDANNVVSFHPADLVREDEHGLWIGGLPATIRLITVGQDFVSTGQTVESHPDTLLAPDSQASR